MFPIQVQIQQEGERKGRGGKEGQRERRSSANIGHVSRASFLSLVNERLPEVSKEHPIQEQHQFFRAPYTLHTQPLE